MSLKSRKNQISDPEIGRTKFNYILDIKGVDKKWKIDNHIDLYVQEHGASGVASIFSKLSKTEICAHKTEFSSIKLYLEHKPKDLNPCPLCLIESDTSSENLKRLNQKFRDVGLVFSIDALKSAKLETQYSDYPPELHNLVDTFAKNTEGYSKILEMIGKKEKIGKGSEGVIYCAIKENETCKYVMKFYDAGEDYFKMSEDVRTEIIRNNQIHGMEPFSKNTIQMYPMLANDPSKKHVVVFMEYAEGRTLYTYLSFPTIPNQTKLQLLKSVVDWIKTLNLSGFYHGDLNPSNIMVSNQLHLTFIDFTPKKWAEPFLDVITMFYYIDHQLRNYNFGKNVADNMTVVVTFYEHVYSTLHEIGKYIAYDITREIINSFLHILAFSIRIHEFLFTNRKKSFFPNEVNEALYTAETNSWFFENAIAEMETDLRKNKYSSYEVELVLNVKYVQMQHGDNMLRFYTSYVLENLNIHKSIMNEEKLAQFALKFPNLLKSGNVSKGKKINSPVGGYMYAHTIGSASIFAFSEIMEYFSLANVFFYETEQESTHEPQQSQEESSAMEIEQEEQSFQWGFPSFAEYFMGIVWK